MNDTTNINITEVADKITNEKFDKYGSNDNDFVGNSEITVRITLNEYRKLVSVSARSQYELEKVKDEKYKCENEIKALRQTIEGLKSIMRNDDEANEG